ncbi:hypothetical protein SAMD00019534_025180, partial [Acytostelium subglobosum LB1]|uniref:hypothetical protein n=1 Tax=Acytostelium subglobosum LB1 TaxID=1410327 RepID=UPI000644991A
MSSNEDEGGQVILWPRIKHLQPMTQQQQQTILNVFHNVVLLRSIMSMISDINHKEFVNRFMKAHLAKPKYTQLKVGGSSIVKTSPYIYRHKYRHWIDGESIINSRHFGLLRDRLRRGLHIVQDDGSESKKGAETEVEDLIKLACRTHMSNNEETFDLLYQRYSSKFVDPTLLDEAVMSDSLHNIRTLLRHNSSKYNINMNMILQAIKQKRFALLQCWAEFVNTPANEVTLRDLMKESREIAKYLFAGRPFHVRNVLAALPTELACAIKSHARYSSLDIVMTGDVQYIEQLLVDDLIPAYEPKEGVKHIPIPYTIRVDPAQQLEHIQRLVDYLVIKPNDKIAMQAPDDLILSCKLLKDLLGDKDYESMLPWPLSDEDKIMYIKIILKPGIGIRESTFNDMFKRYVSTGDCSLLPLLIRVAPYSLELAPSLFNAILHYGTTTQYKIADRLIHSVPVHSDTYANTRSIIQRIDRLIHRFIVEDNSDVDRQLQMIKCINDQVESKVVKPWQGVLVFDGAPAILEFLLSTNNRVLPMDPGKTNLVVHNHTNLQMVLSSVMRPRMHTLSMAYLAIMLSKPDMLELLLLELKDKYYIELLLFALKLRPNYAIIDMLLNKPMKMSNSLWYAMGSNGNVDTLAMIVKRSSSKVNLPEINSLMIGAITMHQYTLLKYMCSTPELCPPLRNYDVHKFAIKHSLELLQCICAIKPPLQDWTMVEAVLNDNDTKLVLSSDKLLLDSPILSLIAFAVERGKTRALDYLMDKEVGETENRDRVKSILLPRLINGVVKRGDTTMLNHLVKNIGVQQSVEDSSSSNNNNNSSLKRSRSTGDDGDDGAIDGNDNKMARTHK